MCRADDLLEEIDHFERQVQMNLSNLTDIGSLGYDLLGHLLMISKESNKPYQSSSRQSVDGMMMQWPPTKNC